jgi:NTE family protein
VLRYIFDAVPEETGEPPRFDIVSGTSVGAINAAWLAATLNDPERAGERLWYLWRTLEFSEVVSVSWREITRLVSEFLGRGDWLEAAAGQEEGGRRGGILDTSYFQRLVREEIPFHNIHRNLDRGLLEAATVSATDIVSGRTTVFAQTASGELPEWTRDPRRVAVGGPLTADKVLASASLPLLFPAVRIGHRWFCDGGLRQNTPLTPALRLGADRVLVITLHAESQLPEPNPNPFDEPLPGPARHYPDYLFLLGKLLDALLLDPLDYDLMVLERINAMLRQAEELFATDESAIEQLNELMRAYRGKGYRIVEPEIIRPSRDLGHLASSFASDVDPDFWGSRILEALGTRAAESAGYGESDLLSYLLFDGGYTSQLLKLGYRDAKARHDDLIDFFAQP